VILRIRQPGGIVRDTPNVPSAPAPLHGHSHRVHAITGGARVTPLPSTPGTNGEWRRAQLAEAAKAYRARKATVRA
jgi:hypothetical protein